MKFMDLTGQRFANWQVISRASNAGNVTRWTCRCSCGKTQVVRSVHIRKGLSTKCRYCRWRGKSELESVIRNQYSSYKSHAKASGRVFELSLTDFTSLVTANCFYCGCSPTNYRKGPSDVKFRKVYPINGVDRKNNSLGYVLSNCVSCCKPCNMMKKASSVDEFIGHCSRIAEHQKGKI